MSWARLARLVLRHPGRVLAASLSVLLAPLVALPALRTTFDVTAELPPDADAVRGFQALEGSFGPGQVQPVVVIARTDDGSVWTEESFRAIDELTVMLRNVPAVAMVRSITRPGIGEVTEDQLEQLGLDEVTRLTEELPVAIGGLERATAGLRRMREGLQEVLGGIPAQRADVGAALAGIDEMRAGLARIEGGLTRIRDGLREAEDGLRQLATDVARPALRAVRRAWRDLKRATVATLDPVYPSLVRNVGQALALLSGRCPDPTGIGILTSPEPQDCPPGEPVAPGYDGLAPALVEIADGLDEAGDGLNAILLGVGAVDDGLARLRQGLSASAPELDRLEAGVREMITGLDRIIPGLEELRTGLQEGTAFLEGGILPDPAEGEVPITASVVEAFPDLRRELRFFVGDGGRATRLFVTLDAPAYEHRSLEAARQIREFSRLAARDTPFEDGEMLVTGTAPFFSDIADVTGGDFRTIVLAVIIGVFLVLVLLLRSLIAPLYLVATVLLSFAATLGLTVIVFQGLLGDPALVWWLPIFLFVILVALGADYNIFLTGRIREEAGRTDSRTAVARGLTATGRVITSAGLILGGTFAALMAAPLEGMVQMGFAAVTGILLDTFVVRSLLVPSIAVLAGSGSWWPSARSRRP